MNLLVQDQTSRTYENNRPIHSTVVLGRVRECPLFHTHPPIPCLLPFGSSAGSRRNLVFPFLLRLSSDGVETDRRRSDLHPLREDGGVRGDALTWFCSGPPVWTNHVTPHC